jgi:hypothetical protein
LSQEGNVVTSKFDRVTTRLSVDTKVNSWLKSGVTMFFYIRSKFSFTKWIKYQSAIQFVYTVPSIYPAYRVDESGGDLILDGKGQRIFDYGATLVKL